MTARPVQRLIPLLLLLPVLLTGCGGGEPTVNNTAAAGDAAANTNSRSITAPGATVFIIDPLDGATVASPVAVKFGISGMAVVPAGQYGNNTGHHHLLIDSKLEHPDQPIPSDAGHLHFGTGQTETTIDLDPGRHTLQLVLGDGSHIPHLPPLMSDIVTITVE